MPDVFISYKHRLRDRVTEIATALRALGLDVWFDEGLTSGDDYAGAISEQLRAAKCVVVTWTPDVFPPIDRHGWVRGEAQKGRDRDVLVAIMLETTDLDPPWNTVQYENLADWTPDTADRTNWRRTLRAIGGLVGRPGLAEFDRAQAAGTSAALTEWAREFSEDPLVPAVWQQIEELEIAATRERLRLERERKTPDVAPVPPKAETPPQPTPQPAPRPQPVPQPEFAPEPAQRAAVDAAAPAVAAPTSSSFAAPAFNHWPLTIATAICVFACIVTAFAVHYLGIYSTGAVVVIGGPAVFAVIHAVAICMMRLLRPLPAVVFVIVGLLGYGVAFVLMAQLSYYFSYDFRFVGEMFIGAIFAVLPMLGALGMLALFARPRPAGAVLKILVVTAATAAVVGICAMLPGFSIRNPDPGFVVLAALWQVGYALGVVWLFRRPQSRAASTI